MSVFKAYFIWNYDEGAGLAEFLYDPPLESEFLLVILSFLIEL